MRALGVQRHRICDRLYTVHQGAPQSLQSWRRICDVSSHKHFRDVMREASRHAATKKEADIIAEARALLGRADRNRVPSFVLERFADVESMIAMIEDKDWNVAGADRDRVVTGLVLAPKSSGHVRPGFV
jgi:hypothetical protein